MNPFRSLVALVFVLGLLLSGLAPAASAQQSGVPEIKLEKYTLANGLQVIFHQDMKLPAVNVNLWYHVGSKNEKPGRTGFAHLFEHMMFQGSKHVEGEFLGLAERAGANLRTGGVNGTTSNDRTNYFETVPSESLEYALWLESDRMGFLLDGLTEEKLSNQRDVVKNEKRQGENQPYGRAFSIIFEELFPAEHPYAHSVIGSMDDLSAATLDDVKQFFRTYYTPNNATLAIVGNFDPAKAKVLIQKYFGPIPAGPALERPKLLPIALDAEKRIAVSDRVPQSRVYLTFPAAAYFQPDQAELDLASSVLADGKTSRLYKSLVYEKQLCSDVNTFNFALESAGAFFVIATARPGKTLAEIETAVDAEIRKLATEGPTAGEIEAAKAKRELEFVNGLQRIGGFGGKADIINTYNTFLGSPDLFGADLARFRKVTPADVKAATARYLDTQKRLVVSYEPEASGRADAQEFDRTKPPAFGERAAFAPPVPKTKTLANGLTVVVVERHELPSVSAALVTKTGSAADPVGKPGLAWMTAEMLDEGTTSRSALQLSAELDRLGSTLGTSGGTESSTVSIGSLTRNLDATVSLMADVALHPSFPAEELERQRQQRLDSILQESQNPAAAAGLTFPKLLYGADHPYGHPTGGTKASIEALTAPELKAFHETNYRPGSSALIFVGDVTLDQAVALAEKQFGSWAKGTAAKVTLPDVKGPAENVVYLMDRQDAPQSQIRIGALGLARTSEDYYAVEVMNTILGGAFASRLNLNLREDKGYSYGAFNGFTFRTLGGYWASSAGVKSEVTKESLVEFTKELRGIAGERPVTADEMAQAKSNLIRGYAQRFEADGQVAGEIGTAWVYGLPLETLGKYESMIDAVTPEQVAAVAKKYIDPARTVILIVGDRAKIEQPVRSLNLGRVVLLGADGKPVTQ